MKYLLALCGSLIITLSFGQNYVTLDQDLLYAKHVYYSFDQGVTASDTGKTWDIGFAVHDQQFGGIFINEYAERDKRPHVFLLAQNKTFNDIIDVSTTVFDTLRNPDLNWNEGALNAIKDPSNPLDYGWGVQAANQSIYGDKVVVVSYPDTTYRKLTIDSLDLQGNYHFKYANLDGSGLRTETFNTTNFPGKTMAHFSLKDKGFKNLEPNNWDLFLTRYNTLANINGGGFLNYTVTGFLSGLNVEVAEADGVDPYTINAYDYCGTFQPEIDIIGFNWKAFNLDDFLWELDEDRVFFVKLPNNDIWKFYIIDFEGAFTGKMVFEQTFIGNICYTVSNQNVPKDSNFNGVILHPNPSDGQLSIAFDLLESRNQIELSVTNLLGQTVFNTTINGNVGLNAIHLPHLDLTAGNYVVQLRSDKDLVTRKWIIAE